METMGIYIIVAVLILGDILLLKIGLAITKAQERKNMKWVAGSFGIQFGIILFISSPLLLYGMIGRFDGNEGVIAPVVLFSVFIDLNVINIIHKIGLKRSIVVVFFVVGPIIAAMVILGSSLGGSP
ncbi:MAG: hypothetical protein KAW03_07590 [Candidatus Lokiarchaeota archaeon]|nr:hypothetical protein [Candidatus Lokiarchaeota archaeon]